MTWQCVRLVKLDVARASALCLTMVACAPSGTKAAPHRDSAVLNATGQAVWKAVIAEHVGRGMDAEADFAAEASRVTDVGDPNPAHRTVLFLRIGQSPVPPLPWLDSLVSGGLVDGVCRADSAESCPDSVPTTFLTPSTPTFSTDSTATLDLADAVMDPGACRRKAGVFMGGIMVTGIDLHRRNGRWHVTGTRPRIHAGTACGFTPEEEARTARREQADSLLRERVTPIAGTYRVTLTFGLGDSAVFYTRTERHPMSALRAASLADLADEGERQIIGYYVMSYSAASPESLPPRGRRRLQTYYAVSTEPIATGSDSSIWRGDVDALVEVTLLDERPEVRAAAQSLFGADDDLRDSSWYFMPGTWVVHTDGRARYDWRLMRGSTLLYRLQAVRISRETAPSRSR